MTTDKTALDDELKILNNNIEAIQEAKARIEGFLFGNKSSCFKIDRKSLEDMAEMFCVIGDYMKTLRPLLADIRFPTQKNGCCDIDPDRCAGMCEDAVKALVALTQAKPPFVIDDAGNVTQVTQPKVDVDLIKADARAFRYPNGHSGVSDNEYMRVHTMDEQLIDHLAAKGLLCNNDAANITQEDLYVTQVPAAPKKEE